MQPHHHTGGASSRSPRPAGDDADGPCPFCHIGQALGANIQDILFSFINGAEDGARLTLQKTRGGFTVQVIEGARGLGEGTYPGTYRSQLAGPGRQHPKHFRNSR